MYRPLNWLQPLLVRTLTARSGSTAVLHQNKPLPTSTFQQGPSQWELGRPRSGSALPARHHTDRPPLRRGKQGVTPGGGHQRVQGTSHVGLRPLQEPRLFIPCVTLCDFAGATLAELARGRVYKVAMHPGNLPGTLGIGQFSLLKKKNTYYYHMD